MLLKTLQRSLILCLPLLSQLCYLHADLFRNLSAKETKKQFVEFYNTFLDKSAVSSRLHHISCKILSLCQCVQTDLNNEIVTNTQIKFEQIEFIVNLRYNQSNDAVRKWNECSVRCVQTKPRSRQRGRDVSLITCRHMQFYYSYATYLAQVIMNVITEQAICSNHFFFKEAQIHFPLVCLDSVLFQLLCFVFNVHFRFGEESQGSFFQAGCNFLDLRRPPLHCLDSVPYYDYCSRCCRC